MANFLAILARYSAIVKLVPARQRRDFAFSRNACELLNPSRRIFGFVKRKNAPVDCFGNFSKSLFVFLDPDLFIRGLNICPVIERQERDS